MVAEHRTPAGEREQTECWGRQTGNRWLRFILVGLAGFVVQLACLSGFRELLDLHYLVAAALAVECAILHNFVWHVRFV